MGFVQDGLVEKAAQDVGVTDPEIKQKAKELLEKAQQAKEEGKTISVTTPTVAELKVEKDIQEIEKSLPNTDSDGGCSCGNCGCGS